jgi:hypothetical protein
MKALDLLFFDVDHPKGKGTSTAYIAIADKIKDN